MRKLPLKTLLMLMTAGLWTLSVRADTVAVPYATNNVGLNFLFPDGGGDTLGLTGLSGVLNLSTSAVTTANIFDGNYTTVYTSGTGVDTFNLTYDLALDGIVHTVSQPAVWTITWGADTFAVSQAAAPVTFATPDGTWLVTPDAFTINNGAKAGMMPFSLKADFTPVTADPSPLPEPGTLGFLGVGLAGLVLFRCKQMARV
jgi:hypothetical protein